MARGGRLFRPDRGWDGWLQALIYAGIYCLSLLLSLWNLLQFDLVIFWPANGVLLAACLQLPRRYSLILLGFCSSLNLLCSLSLDGEHVSNWTEPLLNLVQVLLATVLTRLFCGASLDMRHPRRILTFAVGAALPAVMLTTGLSIGIMAMVGHYDVQTQFFLWRHIFLMEYLGLLTMTPCLLLWGQGRGDRIRLGKWAEGFLLMGLLALVVAWVFLRPEPSLFVVVIPLMALAYRQPPPWVGAGVMLMALISGVLTLYGFGPIREGRLRAEPELAWAPDLMQQVPVYYGFILVMMAVALPISARTTDRRRMVVRLGRHSRKAREQSQIAREAVATKTRFLALISHEMRTPLNAILGFSRVLHQRKDLPADAKFQVEAVAGSGESLKVLIDDLLEAAKGNDDLSLDVHDLGQLLHQSVAEDSAKAVAKGLGVRLDIEAVQGVSALCDGRHIRAAIHQLLSNAVKFTPKGQVSLSARVAQGMLVVQVEDQGSGIPQSVVPRIFDLFTQEDDATDRNYSGAGLGLPAARRHARVMGGDVVLLSTSAEGSIFQLKSRVEIQTEIQAKVQNEVPNEIRANTVSDRGEDIVRILIVDDHALNRSVLRVMLSNTGYQIEEAESGQAALALMAQRPFDLVLMDLRMPGMDGFETSRQMRLGQQERGPQGRGPQGRGPVIVAVTADSGPDLAARLAAAGLDGLLTKPFGQERLLALIERALTQGRVGAGAEGGGPALVG